MQTFLEIKKLTKDFGGLRAVNSLDLNVHREEILGLIGPNGSGKTTIFNLITGVIQSTRGEVYFNNKRTNILKLKPHQITKMGIARTFQTQQLFNNLTVMENVMVSALCKTRSNTISSLLNTPFYKKEEKDVRKKTMEILGIFGTRLLSMANEPAWTLSYANRRRLEIARALASGPLLLLLDEPAAGMNPYETKELMKDIKGFRDMGITIFLIEHDITVIKGICDRVVAIDYGTKVAEGTFSEVRYNEKVIQAYLGRKAKIA